MEKKHEPARVLITGSGGQLGFELMKRCPEGVECRGVDLPEADITDREAFRRICSDFRPGAVINAAAYTAVDKAETEEEAARLVNATGAGNVAAAAEDSGARIISISTDFVFAGDAGRPYRVSDPARPQGVYGQTKLEGEH